LEIRRNRTPAVAVPAEAPAAEAVRALAAQVDRLAAQGDVPRPVQPVPAPPFVDQLLSEESLRKTGYFDPAAVAAARAAFPRLRHGHKRMFIEMGLVAVMAKQLWHHQYIDSSLADLPGHRQTEPAAASLTS
jgi:hypothetical protein